jgi:branched-chain amino acid aminotransferase
MGDLTTSIQALQALKEYEAPTELPFGKHYAPIMFVSDYKDGKWGDLQMEPYGPISLSPACKVLHYGQEIFEGMKAYKTENKGPFLFRPIENFKRMNFSARRLAIPEIPEELFMTAVREMTAHMASFIPKRLGESLYLRPFIFATEPNLGIRASEQFKFLVIAAPVGNYFSGSDVEVYIERKNVRATPGGTGCAKAGGNYAASLLASRKAKNLGYEQTLWLDATHHRYVEELSGMNIFFVVDDELWTPEITDSILRGITRDSIVKLASTMNIKVKETRVDIDQILSFIKSGRCTEAFACGTAAVLAPIKTFGEENGERTIFPEKKEKLSMKLREKLLNIQTGAEQGPEGWVEKIEPAFKPGELKNREIC